MSYDDIFAPFQCADPKRPFVVGQLGQSLDGRIATANGHSRWINGGAAIDHLHRIRAQVDCVIVGIGTVLADDPMLTVRRVSGRSPARAVIDPNGRLPETARIISSSDAPCFVVRGPQRHRVPRGVTPVVIDEHEAGMLPPAQIVAALFALGFKRMLVEGGAVTLSACLDAGVIDRLHLLVAPKILGSGVAGLSLPPIKTVDEALTPLTSVHVLDGGDVLFDCDLRRDQG